MRRYSAIVLALSVILLFSVPFLARPQKPIQSTSVQMPSGAQVSAMLKNKPLVPQGTDGGLWRTDRAFVSTLMLKNVLLVASIPVTPILYMADGTEFDLPPVNLDPAGVAIVNINAALQNAPPAIQPHISEYGSVGVRFNWLWAGAVTAAVRSGDDIRSLVYLSHPHSDITKTRGPAAVRSSQVLEGMWWKQQPGVTGFMALNNTSADTITSNLEVFDSIGGSTIGRSIVLSPHNSVMIDLTSMWDQLVDSPAQGGLRVSYTGTHGAIGVDGGLEDPDKGYSHTLRLGNAPDQTTATSTLPSFDGGTSPNTIKKVSLGVSSQVISPAAVPAATINLDSAGIMVGTQDANMQFPQGTQFVPYLVLRNMSLAAIPIQLTATYSAGPTPTNVSLGSIELPAKSIEQIDLQAMLAKVGLNSYGGFLNLRTSYYGHSSDILEETGSVDQTQSYVFEVPPTMEGPSRGKLVSYWNTSGDNDTMVSLWNYSDKDENLVLTLYYQAGQYKLPVHLAPNRSVSISLASLIKSGKPDADGNTIPGSIVQGSAKLTGARGDLDTIDVILHSAIFNVRTGTCTVCCTYCNYLVASCITPGDITEGVGEVTNETPFVLLYYDGCPEDISLDMDWDTSSGDSTIATVDSGGDVTGVGPGTTSISGRSGEQYSTQTAGDCLGYPNFGFCGPYQYVSYGAWITVQPVITSITKSARLWFFGTGITPSGYNTSETLTAVTQGGFVNGTYVWTITTGTSKVTLSNSSSTDTVTNTTTMGLSSTSFSTAANDVTVQVGYTSPDGNVTTTKTVSLDVDSPYQLACAIDPACDQFNFGESSGNCNVQSNTGTSGYSSSIPYNLLSRIGNSAMSGFLINESLVGSAPSGSGYGTPSPENGLITGTQFSDEACQIHPTATPHTIAPLNSTYGCSSSGTTLVFQMTQAWYAGSMTSSMGLKVQTDDLTYYQDHGAHCSRVSPP
jgi:hypothetical protein